MKLELEPELEKDAEQKWVEGRGRQGSPNGGLGLTLKSDKLLFMLSFLPVRIRNEYANEIYLLCSLGLSLL